MVSESPCSPTDWHGVGFERGVAKGVTSSRRRGMEPSDAEAQMSVEAIEGFLADSVTPSSRASRAPRSALGPARTAPPRVGPSPQPLAPAHVEEFDWDEVRATCAGCALVSVCAQSAGLAPCRGLLPASVVESVIHVMRTFVGSPRVPGALHFDSISVGPSTRQESIRYCTALCCRAVDPPPPPPPHTRTHTRTPPSRSCNTFVLPMCCLLSGGIAELGVIVGIAPLSHQCK